MYRTIEQQAVKSANLAGLLLPHELASVREHRNRPNSIEASAVSHARRRHIELKNLIPSQEKVRL